MEFFVLAIVLATIGFVLRFVFAAFVVKQSVDLYKQHWDAFNQTTMEQKRILQNLNTGATSTSNAELILQFMNEQFKTQEQARHLDKLRQSQANSEMARIMSIASQAGVTINPNDFKV